MFYRYIFIYAKKSLKRSNDILKLNKFILTTKYDFCDLKSTISTVVVFSDGKFGGIVSSQIQLRLDMCCVASYQEATKLRL